jgi:hypothetical protein
MNVWATVREIIFSGLLRGWPGARCPDCGVRPLQKHKNECPTGKWDGGVWA